MVLSPSNKKPTHGGRSSYVQTRLSGRVVVLQAELGEQREHPQAVDVIRREQHIDPARVLTVTLDNQVLGEQLGVFHVACQLQLGVLGDQLTANGSRQIGRASGRERVCQ